MTLHPCNAMNGVVCGMFEHERERVRVAALFKCICAFAFVLWALPKHVPSLHALETGPLVHRHKRLWTLRDRVIACAVQASGFRLPFALSLRIAFALSFAFRSPPCEVCFELLLELFRTRLL